MSTAPEPTVRATSELITVYWRPGCAFCTRLLRWIDRAGLPTRRRNIWEDPEAAAVVRDVTGGDETVPTVVIGAHAMVNPSPRALQAAIAAHAPELLPADEVAEVPRRWWERGQRSG